MEKRLNKNILNKNEIKGHLNKVISPIWKSIKSSHMLKEIFSFLNNKRKLK